MQVTGSIKTLVHGVSTQHPRERLEGQHHEQINMIPDPVEGVVKRPGVKWTNTVELAMADALNYEWQSFSLGTGDYAIGCLKGVGGGNLVIIDQATGDTINLWQHADSEAYFEGGIKAMAGIGDYMVLASDIVPAASSVTGPDSSTKALIEVRQGAYGAVFTLTRSDTGATLATYTVPDGSSAAHTANAQPGYIAQQLYNALATGVNGITAKYIANGNITVVCDSAAAAARLKMDDQAYNSRARIVYSRWPDTSTLPPNSFDGHTIQVGGLTGGATAVYYKFVQTSNAGDANIPSIGRWEETLAPGAVGGGTLTTTTLPRLLLIYEGKAYIGTGSQIAAQVLADTTDVIEAVDWFNRTTGNELSNPVPLFVGNAIRWMGTMHDRLVILTNKGISFSATSDYLKFYRSTVSALLDSDTIHLPNNADSKDVLTGAVQFDRNLLVIGTKTHRIVGGRAPLSPRTAILAETISFTSDPQVAPVALGNQAYFASQSANNMQLLSVETGDTTDSTKAFSVSSHVDGYVPGDVRQLLASTQPELLFVRTGTGLWLYRTLFNQQERLLSSWFRFVFPENQEVATMSMAGSVLTLLFTRRVGNKTWVTTGTIDFEKIGYSGAAAQRYLDFWRTHVVAPPGGVTSFTGAASRSLLENTSQAIDTTSNLSAGTIVVTGNRDDGTFSATCDLDDGTYLIGTPYEWVLVPTLPLPRNSQGEVLGIGLLTIGQMKVTYSVSAGFTVRMTDTYRDNQYDHSARRVGASNNIIGQAVITSGAFKFPVGSNDPEARVRISSTDHYPTVLTGIDWSGQYFKSGRVM